MSHVAERVLYRMAGVENLAGDLWRLELVEAVSMRSLSLFKNYTDLKVQKLSLSRSQQPTTGIYPEFVRLYSISFNNTLFSTVEFLNSPNIQIRRWLLVSHFRLLIQQILCYHSCVQSSSPFATRGQAMSFTYIYCEKPRLNVWSDVCWNCTSYSNDKKCFKKA